MNSPVDQIKARLDLADFVGQYVKLSRAGVNMKGLCPFHNEKSPSFFVSPARQTWHCFGCNKGGDAFSFLQEIEGVTFREALETLGTRTGVEVKRERPEVRDARDKARDANSLAAQFFAVQLAKSKAGAAAEKYLNDRGLKEETVKTFQIGWAPNKDTALLDYLKSRGLSESDIVDGGLAIRTKRGTRDRFRGRIMFPIADGNNRVVGFTGRIFGREEGEYDPKYSNSPETPIFEKRRMLYGLNLARRAIRERGATLLVEGQMDALMAHQAGDSNAVATSGTALTEQHITTLSRLADTLIVAYDADAAGIASTKRSIELALAGGMNVKVALVPEGKDPADLILKSPDAWRNLLEKGVQPVIAFFIEQAIAEYGTETPEAKQRIVAEVLPYLARMSNATEQGEWASHLASAVHLSKGKGDEDIYEQLRMMKKSPTLKKQEETSGEAEEKEISRRRMLEEHFLALLLYAEDGPEGAEHLLSIPEHQKLHGHIVAQKGEKTPEERTTSLIEAAGDELREYTSRVALLAERLLESVRDFPTEVESAAREIRRFDIREKLDALSLKLEEAERSGNSVEIRELTEQFRTASRDLAGLATV